MSPQSYAGVPEPADPEIFELGVWCFEAVPAGFTVCLLLDDDDFPVAETCLFEWFVKAARSF